MNNTTTKPTEMSNNKHTQVVDFSNPNADKIISASTQEQMSLDLNKLANNLDEALSNETTETLTKFLNDKRMTNNKQQTVVQQIVQALDIECKSRGMNVNWDMYLEMEKQQHATTWDKSMDNLDARGGNIVRAWGDFDQYYNETYGGNK